LRELLSYPVVSSLPEAVNVAQEQKIVKILIMNDYAKELIIFPRMLIFD
jgi:hypothetical protein